MAKNFFSRITRYISDKEYRFTINDNYFHLYRLLSDKKYLKKRYKISMNKKLDFNNPVTFNEKLQWLKIYNHNPKYTQFVDKFEVREYIKNVLGEEYLIPLIGCYNSPNEINFDSLPKSFVLKCNHNSGKGMIICRDKEKLNKNAAIKELKKGIKQNYYLYGREWPYKNVKRKIICEKFMTDGKSKEGLTDFKFFCFNGYVDCVMVCIDRYLGDTKFYFFDNKWKLKRINKRGKEAPKDFTLDKPASIDKMFQIASKLSQGIPFVRVDLYECDGKIYFGEMTFFPNSGFDSNLLPETDMYFGSLIHLEEVKQ